MQFMAIEVLQKVDHTYRHDLESFFYVLLWMCARCSWDKGLAKARCGLSQAAYGNGSLEAFRYFGCKEIAYERQWTQRRLRWISDGVWACEVSLCGNKEASVPLGKTRKCLLELLRDTPRSSTTPYIAAFDKGIEEVSKEWYGSVCQSP